MAGEWKDPKKVETLTRLWATVSSVNEIGRLMGISRHSVTSKAHKLRLPPRPNPIVVQGRRATPSIPRAKGPTLPGVAPLAFLAAQLPVSPERLTSSRLCCFPLWGNAKPTHEYCGKPVMAGRIYCEQCWGKTHTRAE
jgi:GcrA cell cycle regulator